MKVGDFSLLFAVLALLCWAAVVAIAIGALVWRSGRGGERLAQLRYDLGRGALPLAWSVSLVVILGSLYYSKVQGYVPCELCWYQRICLYPWAVILGIATFRRDSSIKVYAIPVLCISSVISLYHSWVQAFPPSNGTSFCTADVPCTLRYVWQFGFVSLPFMALSAAVAMIALLSIATPSESESTEELA